MILTKNLEYKALRDFLRKHDLWTMRQINNSRKIRVHKPRDELLTKKVIVIILKSTRISRERLSADITEARMWPLAPRNICSILSTKLWGVY